MNRAAKFIITILLALGYVTCLISCVSTTPLKPLEATPQKGTGKLITIDGYIFPYKFYPSPQKGPSVIYIPGMSGNSESKDASIYVLKSVLNNANFNFIGFDRGDASSSPSLLDQAKNTAKRSKSGSIYFPSKDGKESAAENIVRNEVTAIIEFIEKAATHDSQKGIYLIGGSMGSWLSLITVRSFSEKIRGVVFLSPAILPEWVKTEQEQYNAPEYFKSLIKAFDQRPALAIGSKNDIIAPHVSKNGSAFDCVRLLREEIGPAVEMMEVSTSSHSFKLVADSGEVRERIVRWLKEKVK